MSDPTTYRTTMSVPSELPAEATQAEELDPFSWAMIQALKRCQDPSNSRLFLPNLLAKGPVQPYRTDSWEFSNLGSQVGGSDAICAGTGGGLGVHDPNENIHLELTNVYVNGLANATPTSWDVHETGGGSENFARIEIAFCTYSEDVLPKGVDSNLVIQSNFDIRQPCQSPAGGKHWIADGKGNLTVTVEAATGLAEMTIYTTGEGDDMKLHADVSTLTFQIGGLDCGENTPRPDATGTDATATDATEDAGPQIKVDVDVTNISGSDKKDWHDYIQNAVNSNVALCQLQKQINSVLDSKDAKDHLASVAIQQIEDILNP